MTSPAEGRTTGWTVEAVHAAQFRLLNGELEYRMEGSEESLGRPDYLAAEDVPFLQKAGILSKEVEAEYTARGFL